MVNKIIILSGKGKGVVKLSGSATCVIEYYHRQPLDVFIHGKECAIFKGVNSGQMLDLPMNLGRNISILLLDNGEAVMHGSSECGVDYDAIYRCYVSMCNRDNDKESMFTRKIDMENFMQSPNSNATTTDVELQSNIANKTKENTDDIGTEIESDMREKNDNEMVLSDNVCAAEASDLSTINDKIENQDMQYNFGTQDKNIDIINANCCEEICSTQDEISMCEKVCNSRFDSSIDCQNEPFYVKIQAQLEELFDTYPCDNELEDIVHDSRWVRIPLDDDYYVVGVIQDDGAPLFICYGLPREERDINKCEIANHAEWLPLDRNEPNMRGYWIMYQNAITGENF